MEAVVPPRPKKFETQKSPGKLLVSVCWDRDGILRVVATITAKHYVALLDSLKQQLVFKRGGKPSRQCCSSQGGHIAPEIGRPSLCSSETPGLLT
jgi:hypothetical protein